MNSKRILLVDDDPQALESTKRILEISGYEVLTASDGKLALDYLKPSLEKKAIEFDVVLTDVRMPQMGGLELLRAVSLCGEKTPVILMTAYGKVRDAVWAMKLGAVDFLMKPFKRQTLLSALEMALKRSNYGLKKSKPENNHQDLLIGDSDSLRILRNQINQVAPTSATVLLTGESGTGKELIAHCIHEQSACSQGHFIALNCAAVPEQLMESELFGHEKGAFTGALAAKVGLFEAAHKGTLFLDEIGDMPLTLQAKLLRTLQEREVRRLGATETKKFDVRVIAATHQDLSESVKLGKFRQDLLYRLEVISIKIPPLREHREDLPLLIQYFLKGAAQRYQKEVLTVSETALEILMAHSWPGNVRELSNAIERAMVFCKGPEIQANDLPPHLQGASADLENSYQDKTVSVRLGTSLKEIEDLMIRKTLEATDGDKNMTARLLGINSRTIYRKQKQLK